VTQGHTVMHTPHSAQTGVASSPACGPVRPTLTTLSRTPSRGMLLSDRYKHPQDVVLAYDGSIIGVHLSHCP
jgi:hypothetical protein